MSKTVYIGGTIGLIIFLTAISYLEGRIQYFKTNSQLIVLAITALIIFFYTYETYRMRREMVNQNELKVMPILEFSPVRTSTGETKFSLHNWGDFPAFKISIESLVIKDARSGRTLKFVFEEINAILPNRSIEIRPKIFKDQKEIIEQQDQEFFSAHFLPEYASLEFKIPVTFRNILNQEYRGILGCGKGGFKPGIPERV
jgi:hypothetical protein